MDLTTQPLYALKNTASMSGMGLAMEGQEGNEVTPTSPVPRPATLHPLNSPTEWMLILDCV